MNATELGFKVITSLIKLIPDEKRPKSNYYTEMRKVYNEFYEKQFSQMGSIPAVIPFAEAQANALIEELPKLLTSAGAGRKSAVATSCIACSRSHLTTIAGALDEGLRFARDGGITDPEAVRRIDAAEKEITIMERIDLSPEAIQNSPPKEKDLAHNFLPKIRKLRQDIGQIASVEQMESAAAEASVLSQEFRLAQMQMAGADLNPIISLAKAVENGEMTLNEAREKVKEYLPKGG